MLDECPLEKEIYEDGSYFLKYLPLMISQWGSVIAFSGTLTTSSLVKFKENYPGAITFPCPSLRENGVGHELKCIRDNFWSPRDILDEIMENQNQVEKNLILIHENAGELEKMMNMIDRNDFPGKKSYVFDDFSSDFSKINTELKLL